MDWHLPGGRPLSPQEAGPPGAPPAAKPLALQGSSYLTRCAPPLGAGPGTGRRRRRERVSKAAGKESRGRTRGSTGAGGSGGHASHIFYLLWCDFRYLTLIGPARHVGPRMREKNLHIFPPSGGDCGHTGCCESPLISGLEKTRSDLSLGTARERRPSGPLGCGWERPTCLGMMAPTPLLRLGGFKFGIVFL